MTLETLILLVGGAVMSVVQELWDAFGPWLGQQKPIVKRLVTVVSYVVAGVLVFGLTCLGWLGLVAPDVSLFCDQSSVLVILKAIFVLAIGGQVTHLLVKRS